MPGSAVTGAKSRSRRAGRKLSGIRHSQFAADSATRRNVYILCASSAKRATMTTLARHPPQAAAVPLLASRHARGRPAPRLVCRAASRRFRRRRSSTATRRCSNAGRRFVRLGHRPRTAAAARHDVTRLLLAFRSAPPARDPPDRQSRMRRPPSPPSLSGWVHARPHADEGAERGEAGEGAAMPNDRVDIWHARSDAAAGGDAVRRARGASTRRCSARLARGVRRGWLHVCRDDGRMARFAAALAFFHPELEVLTFPAWDCLPYDRVSPNGEIVSRRIDTLTRLAARPHATAAGEARCRADHGQRGGAARAAAQAVRRPGAGAAAPAGASPLDRLQSFFRNNGYVRTDTVREPGEFAVRGGIVDLYPAGRARSRCGSISSATRSRACARFDPLTQRSTGTLERGWCCSRSARCCSTSRRSTASASAIASSSAPSAPTTRSTNRSAPGAAMSAWSIGCRSITSGSRRCSTICPRRRLSFDHQAEEVRAHRLDADRRFLRRAAQRDRAPRAAARRSTARCAPSSSISTSTNGRALSPAAGRAVVALRRARECSRPVRCRRAARRAISPPSAPTPRSILFEAVRDYLAAEREAGRKPRSPPTAPARPTGSRPCCASAASPICAGSPTARRCAQLPTCVGRARRAAARAGLRDRRARRCSASRTFSATGWRARRAGGAISTSSSPRREPRRRAISSSMPSTASAATRGWRRSTSPARRMIACACSMPATTSCSCRSRTSRCCRAMARRRPGRSSTGSAASPGSRARRGSSSASATSPAS